jgi:hypothetical protein
MISFAGDLRREAKLAAAPKIVAKVQIAAKTPETQAMSRVRQTGPLIGKLLDTFACAGALTDDDLTPAAQRIGQFAQPLLHRLAGDGLALPGDVQDDFRRRHA